MNEYTSSAGIMWPATFPGSENIEDPHCTVVYLGDKSQIRLSPSALLLVTNRYADAPGEVQVTGVEQFGQGEDDAVWVATLDDSELGELQANIKATAERFGFKDASSFPDYRPHVTLGKKTGEEPPEAPASVTLGPLEAWWGNDHIR